MFSWKAGSITRTGRTPQLTIDADLKNQSGHTMETTVKGAIGGVSFGENFTLQPGEKRSVELTPEKNPGLHFPHAQLWWPWELGEPHLYDLKLSAETGGEISDARQRSFWHSRSFRLSQRRRLSRLYASMAKRFSSAAAAGRMNCCCARAKPIWRRNSNTRRR